MGVGWQPKTRVHPCLPGVATKEDSSFVCDEHEPVNAAADFEACQLWCVGGRCEHLPELRSVERKHPRLRNGEPFPSADSRNPNNALRTRERG